MQTTRSGPVTNEEVAACARPSCKDCHGKGWYRSREATGVAGVAAVIESLCDCAERRFKMRYADRVVMLPEGLHWGEPGKAMQLKALIQTVKALVLTK